MTDLGSKFQSSFNDKAHVPQIVGRNDMTSDDEARANSGLSTDAIRSISKHIKSRQHEDITSFSEASRAVYSIDGKGSSVDPRQPYVTECQEEDSTSVIEGAVEEGEEDSYSPAESADFQMQHSRASSRSGSLEPSINRALTDPSAERPSVHTPETVPRSGAIYSDHHIKDNAKVHYGNVYNYVQANSDNIGIHSSQYQGFTFSMDPYIGDPRGKSLFACTSKLRSQYVSTKQLSMPLLLDHVDMYKPYAKVKSTKLRNSLVRMARLCFRLDRLFAALYVHLLQAQGPKEVDEHLGRIRHEIQEKHRKDSASGHPGDKVYLGDLGHFCEALLGHKLANEASIPGKTMHQTPEFHVTHGTKDTLLQYLQDGLEVPYWKMMLDFFSTFRENETSLGSDAVALAITSMRSEVYKARRQLDVTINASMKSENIDDLMRGIEKRIAILSSFTDPLVADTDDEDGETTVPPGSQLVRRQTTRTGHEQDSTTPPQQDQGKLSTTPKAQSSPPQKPATPAPFYLNSILTTLSIMAILAGMVPFVEGFCIARDSVELGTKQDADYWMTISNGLTVIFSNLAMVLPLWKGSWTIKTHLITAFWVVTGVGCAITSMAIYEGYNTAWSSFLAFFATVAGFAATLSIAMTEGKADLGKEMGRDQESKKDR